MSDRTLIEFMPPREELERLRAENAELQRRLEAAESEAVVMRHLFRVVETVTGRIAESLDAQRIFEAGIDALVNLTGARRVTAYRYLPQQEKWFLQAHYGIRPDEREAAQVLGKDNARVLALALERDTALFVRDIERDLGLPNLARHGGRSLMVLPLRAGRRLLGHVCLSEKIDGTPFGDMEFDLAALCVRHIGVAFENAIIHRRLRTESITDALTGLHIRRFFNEQFEREIGRANRYGTTFSLILFDIDHFKRINDQYGHGVGDGVLAFLGRIVLAQLRRTDLGFRVGGEEFALLLPGTDFRGAGVVAERLRQAVMTAKVPLGGGADPIQFTVSAGVGEYVPRLDKDTFYDQVDQALYRVKHTTRNRVEVVIPPPRLDMVVRAEPALMVNAQPSVLFRAEAPPVPPQGRRAGDSSHGPDSWVPDSLVGVREISSQAPPDASLPPVSAVPFAPASSAIVSGIPSGLGAMVGVVSGDGAGRMGAAGFVSGDGAGPSGAAGVVSGERVGWMNVAGFVSGEGVAWGGFVGASSDPQRFVPGEGRASATQPPGPLPPGAVRRVVGTPLESPSTLRLPTVGGQTGEYAPPGGISGVASAPTAIRPGRASLGRSSSASGRKSAVSPAIVWAPSRPVSDRRTPKAPFQTPQEEEDWNL